MHTSYPYGNPTRLDHPAALGVYPFGKGELHLYSQLTYDASSPLQPQPYTRQGISGASYSTHAQHSVWRSGWAWDDLALGELLPIDQRKIEAERAAKARKGATGTGASGGGGAAQNPSAPPPPPGPAPTIPPPPSDEDVAATMAAAANAAGIGSSSVDLDEDDFSTDVSRF